MIVILSNRIVKLLTNFGVIRVQAADLLLALIS